GERRDGASGGAHRFRETRRLAFDQCSRRLGRDVADGKAGASGRHDEITAGQSVPYDALDVAYLVGHDTPRRRIAGFLEKTLDGLTRRVDARAVEHTVTHRHDRCTACAHQAPIISPRRIAR